VAICLCRVAAPWIGTGQLVPLFGMTAPATSSYYMLVERDLSARPEVASFADWLTATFA